MAATRIDETNRAVRIHLADPAGGTMCGILRMNIIDHDARTGWPDCNDCIKAIEPKPEPPSWQIAR